MDTAKKTLLLKQDFDDVRTAGIEQGEQAEYDRLWDAFQQKGYRTNYSYAFRGSAWKVTKDGSGTTFKPKYSMKPQYMYYMFDQSPVFEGDYFSGYAYYGDLGEYFETLGITFDTGDCTSMQYAFWATGCKILPEIDTRGLSSLKNVFYYMQSVNKIKNIILKDDGSQDLTGMFSACYNMTEIRFEGTIGKSGLDVWELGMNYGYLSVESLLSIINALKDYSTDTSGQSWTVKLGTRNLEKLTDEQKKIATDKGWTLT